MPYASNAASSGALPSSSTSARSSGGTSAWCGAVLETAAWRAMFSTSQTW